MPPLPLLKSALSNHARSRGRGHRVSFGDVQLATLASSWGLHARKLLEVVGVCGQTADLVLSEMRESSTLWTDPAGPVENRGALGAICTVKRIGVWVGSVLLWCCCWRAFCHLGKPCPRNGQDERTPGAASSIFSLDSWAAEPFRVLLIVHSGKFGLKRRARLH
jgi:hypothetical protein